MVAPGSKPKGIRVKRFEGPLGMLSGGHQFTKMQGGTKLIFDIREGHKLILF